MFFHLNPPGLVGGGLLRTGATVPVGLSPCKWELHCPAPSCRALHFWSTAETRLAARLLLVNISNWYLAEGRLDRGWILSPAPSALSPLQLLRLRGLCRSASGWGWGSTPDVQRRAVGSSDGGGRAGGVVLAAQALGTPGGRAVPSHQGLAGTGQARRPGAVARLSTGRFRGREATRPHPQHPAPQP